MSDTRVPELVTLLGETDASARNRAWTRLLERHSGLLLHAARSFGAGYDDAMDRYRYILEELRRDNFKRLRAYSPEGQGKFSTWLVVVSQRLCRDFHRQRFGRLRANPDSEAGRARVVRWRLQELIAERIDASLIAETPDTGAEMSIRRRELETAVAGSLATLEPRDRLLIRYRFEDGRSAGEIAALLRLPSVFHVYRRLRVVLATLRRRLKDLGVTDAAP
jgi:RNA polymerase sigma factor (sigma-70 family)